MTRSYIQKTLKSPTNIIRINKFSSFKIKKQYTKKLVALLYIILRRNYQKEKLRKNLIYNSTKNNNILKINLTKKMKDISMESYETLMK